MNLLNSTDLTPLPRRAPESHKGDFGCALLVGGSRGMSGAIALAGMAALRSGAGLVKLAVPDVCLDTVAAFEPAYMTAPLPSDDEGRIDQRAKERIAKLSQSATCVACGPGMGRSDGLTELVSWMYKTLLLPMVFDADALNGLASQRDGLADPGGPRIVTPHPGEFLRMIGADKLNREDLSSRAVEMAGSHGIVVVLKGHQTLITDGERQMINSTGNPGMATGGTGDVLTGLIAALVCQGLSPFEAARLGAHLHGLAGDLAAEEYGQVSMTATDVVEFLSDAFQDMEN